LESGISEFHLPTVLGATLRHGLKKGHVLMITDFSEKAHMNPD
jgi:hypothetical protein